jgi:hypothetical protein
MLSLWVATEFGVDRFLAYLHNAALMFLKLFSMIFPS